MMIAKKGVRSPAHFTAAVHENPAFSFYVVAGQNAVGNRLQGIGYDWMS
ncbi:MAG: hypothetical protein AAF936_08530 [Pseudomonadota bacterium]